MQDMQKDHDKAHGELTKSLSEKDAALQKSQDELARKNEELTGTKTAHDKKILVGKCVDLKMKCGHD